MRFEVALKIMSSRYLHVKERAKNKDNQRRDWDEREANAIRTLVVMALANQELGIEVSAEQKLTSDQVMKWWGHLYSSMDREAKKEFHRKAKKKSIVT